MTQADFEKINVERMIIGLNRSDVSKTVALMVLTTIFSVAGVGQRVVDKTVAVVRDANRSELITYSDLMWQLALQPTPQLDPPRSEDLNQALQTLISQRLFALEANRIPRAGPSPKEISDEINRLLTHFPSVSAFEERLKKVGFQSVKDEAFERMISQRLSIEKYVDFRFRSFVVVTADEEARYYRDVFVPDFRRRSPGSILPTLDERRADIRKSLIEDKVAASIERFLDEARSRTEVEMLIEI